MKISIGRLKEIIMEEVAKAAAVEETFKPASEMPPEWQAKAQPGSPAAGELQVAKCAALDKKITNIWANAEHHPGGRDWAQWEENNIRNHDSWKANDCDKHHPPPHYLSETLNIEIVDDE